MRERDSCPVISLAIAVHKRARFVIKSESRVKAWPIDRVVENFGYMTTERERLAVGLCY